MLPPFKPAVSLSTPCIDQDVVGILAQYIDLYQPPTVMHNFRMACKSTAAAGQPPVERIAQFLAICKACPSISRHPRRLHLALGDDQQWVSSEEMDELVNLLKERANVEFLSISSGEEQTPGDGYMLGFTIERLASSIKTLQIDNIVDIPHFLLSKFSQLEKLDMRGATGEGSTIPPSFRPSVKTLICFHRPTVGGDLDPPLVFDAPLMPYLAFDETVSIRCDALQYRQFQAVVGHRPTGCTMLETLAVDVSILCSTPRPTASSNASTDPMLKSIFLPSLRNLIVQVVIKRRDDLDRGMKPIEAVACMLNAVRSGRPYHALVRFVSAHCKVRIDFRFLRQSNAVLESQLLRAHLSLPFLRAQMPLVAQEGTATLTTLDIYDTSKFYSCSD
ncbi:hypothetical protein BKA70DRAFT_1439339 [Coprinopsis sp. MPI-PUGE-AT-0042]|nr:hypothetical protein BKA70DRAFT_1439339 [Coprinopsis sp. MPI-PUGE-AT-0042]